MQTRYPFEDIQHQLEAIQVVDNSHIERRCRCPFFTKAAHMKALAVCALVNQSVYQGRIAMKGKNDGFILGKQRDEFVVRQPMRVLLRRLQHHEVDDIYHSDT
ncbi:hypothetical protein D9M71_772550 [compost metagenome]